MNEVDYSEGFRTRLICRVIYQIFSATYRYFYGLWVYFYQLFVFS